MTRIGQGGRGVECLLLTITAAIVAANLLSQPAAAQVLYGSIVGTVTDPTGAVIPGARVEITNTATQQSRTAATNASGQYSIANVLPGTYDLQVTAEGFRAFTETGLVVTANRVVRADPVLEVGQVTEQVTVEAAALSLQTDKTDVHTELAAREVTDLPLAKYRNYQSLINLVPGATPARFQNANTDTPARALTTNINGVNRNNNNTKLDGATNVYIWLPHHTAYVAPAETVESVSISTNNFDAEQGMAGGAAITVVTKSGTNDFHGSAFYLHENSKWGAKNFFFKDPKTPKSLVHISGYTIGGPIKKNKLFFFHGWEGMRERVNRNALFTVATEDQRRGDFSALQTTIYDPATGDARGSGRTPFPNNVIPLARQSSITRKMQDLVPLPNQPGVASNFFNSATQRMNRDNFDTKINWNRTPTHTIWGKWSIMDAQVTGEFGLGAAGGSCLCDGGTGTGDTVVNVGTIGQTWVISPTFLMDTVIGFTRMGQENVSNDIGTNFGLEVLGIPGTNGPDIRQSGIPRFDISGYSPLGQVSGWIPAFRNDQSWTLNQNFSLVKGSHDLRFGFEGIRHHLNHWQPELGDGPRGRFSFNQSVTGLRGGSPNQFNGYASFLLGLPQFVGKAIQHEKMTAFENQFALYFRDRWQATRKLTLTLGVRWEKYPLMTRAGRGGIELWDQNTNEVQLGGNGGNPKDLGITTSNKLFAPRVGFAYRVSDWLVVRSGYGITYNPMPLARPLRGFYPLTVAQRFEGENAFQAFGPIENGIPDFGGPPVDAERVPLPATALMRTISDPELKRGYVQSWNFILETKLPGEFVTSFGYVGTQTVRSFGDRDINVAGPGEGQAGRPLRARFGFEQSMLFWNGQNSANYHALQIAINRRAADGLTLKGAYTYSRAINMTDDDGWAGVMFNYGPHVQRNRAQAGYNQPHIFQMGFVYDLPFGSGRRYANQGVARWIFGDWQINGVFAAFQGRPFTVTGSAGSLDAPGNTQTADQVKPEVKKIGSLDEFYDKSAFANPTGEPRFGTTGRNLLRGPGRVNLDFSLFRNFPLRGERLGLQFRAEAFNLSNTPHFNNPNGSVTSSNFMRITSADNTQRTIRFGLRLHW